ncbi:ABC transporter permease [Bradyrhizobium ivorense]|uniref:ABC transporter permease n=1 Tax=Bradyrhizobium ivorense TaxID=2511166 RepID=UPI0010B6D8C2|nr:ABC transporter permease [Bradyrhizobium ivorense]VIO71854.1 Spermidine/putrescine transport system permease protein PotB [Bradyrhizobium ivorense]
MPASLFAPLTERPSLNRVLLRTLVVIAYLIIFAPVTMIVVTSFFAQEIVSFPPTALTWRWYVNAWDKPEFFRGLLTSLQIALIAAAIGVPIGTAAALAIVRGEFPGKQAISALLLAPLAVPGVVAGSGLYMFYVLAENALDRDIKATTEGLVAAHVLLTIPWTVRLVVASLQGLDRAAEEAAANLGASPFTVFRRITLPMMRPGIVAAAMFSFIQSFENLDLSLLLVGPGRITLPVAMLNYLEFRIDPTLAAVATVQILIVGVLMVVTDRFVKLSRVV